MFGFEKDNPGFSIVEIIVAIMVVIFVGFALWVVLKTSHAHKIALTNNGVSNTVSIGPKSVATPPSSSTPKITNTTSGTTTTSTADQSLLVIGSSSLEITVPNDLSDLTYNISTSSNGLMTITFSTASITSQIPKCAANVGNGAFDTLIKGNGQYPNSANSSSGGLIKQESTYYIAYNLPTGPCATGLTTDQQSLLDQDDQSFYSSLQSVQPAS